MSSSSSISSFSLVGRRLWGSYTEALIARPLLVKGSTASFIFFISDSVTQRYVNAVAETDEKENDFDWARAGSGAAFGVVATGWLHYWWNFLEVAVGKRLPVATHRFTNTITKVAIDQLVGAPIYIFTYYVITHGGKEYISTLRNDNDNNNNQSQPALQLFRDTCTRAADMLPPTMLRHWTLWPAVHTLNFYYNPLHHRVLVQNLVLVGWSAYLSHLNNGGLLRIMTPEEEVEVAVTETVELLRRETSATKKGKSVTNSATTTTHHTTEVHILPAARRTASAAPVAAATRE